MCNITMLAWLAVFTALIMTNLGCTMNNTPSSGQLAWSYYQRISENKERVLLSDIYKQLGMPSDDKDSRDGKTLSWAVDNTSVFSVKTDAKKTYAISANWAEYTAPIR